MQGLTGKIWLLKVKLRNGNGKIFYNIILSLIFSDNIIQWYISYFSSVYVK